MKALGGVVASLGLFGIFIAIGLGVFTFGLSLYGLYLAFSASIILGIAVLLVEPSPFVIGLVMFFFQKNLAQILIDWLNK